MISAAAADERVVLALTGITKRFGASVALDHVSFSLRAGTVHALLGENGAGKTTLMNVAFGLLAPDAGTVVVDGAPWPIAVPSDAIRAGIGMVHQHFTNVAAMTVAENVALGGSGRYDAAVAAATVVSIAERTGLALDPRARAGELPVGAQQRLEIVKALARDARILILDEPTAVLAPAEAGDLLAWIRRFADSGSAVVLITHKLREALAVTDEVTVLRRGRVVHAGPTHALNEQRLASLLLGETPAETGAGFGGPASPSRAIVASVRDLVLADDRGAVTVRGATLDVRAGEIVGIAAVEGSGQRELLRALAGRAAPRSGRLTLPATIAFVPEDRHRDAMVVALSLAENVAIKGAGRRRGWIDWRSERAHTARLLDEYDVRGAGSAGASAAARTLSGGNQQKLVLGRELDGSPQLVVAENPTRGLDIRASDAVRERLRRAAASGAGVVVYSSDLDEVLSLATRMLVVHAGRLTEAPLDREAVGRAMLGVAEGAA